MIKDAFIEAVRHYFGNEILSKELWRDIEKKYSGPRRHYHTLSHLENLFKTLTPFRSYFENWHTIVFAIVYHDIIYNTLKSNNEEKSASYARKALARIGCTTLQSDRCEALILATKKHQASGDNEINLFTDSDLSILGAERFVYVQYLEQIRAEYSLYPDFIYVPGRIKALKHFLAMDRIFKTSEFYNEFESKARANIEYELEKIAVED